jgi:hypothetical protein
MVRTSKMLSSATCASGSVYITCFSLYGPSRQQKIHSLMIDCSNFITNVTAPGEFLRPKPTRFSKILPRSYNPVNDLEGLEVACDMLGHLNVTHAPAEYLCQQMSVLGTQDGM